MDTPAPGVDWRNMLQPESRQKIVNKIMDTLKRHLPFSGQEGLQELKKIAVRFEEKIFTAAESQSDYLRKISLKMLTMESKSHNSMTNSLQCSAPGNNPNGPDSGSSLQPQVNSQGQQLPMPIVTNQPQAHQQLLSQNVPSNLAQNGMQGSATLASTLASVPSLSQTTMPNVVGQNPNLSNMQNISSGSQNPLGNQMGQTGGSNIFANSQRQMQQVRQQQVVTQQPQQQSQHSQHYLYQQQLQNEIIKQKFQSGNMSHSVIQSHIQQQQQQQQSQSMLQSTQVQSSQQSVMQHSGMQSTSLSGLQHNQQSTQPVLQQPPQSVRQPQQSQQTPIIHQQQPSIHQQQQQQQQQLISQQSNTINMQPNQLIGQQNNIPDMHHHHQQQQRLLSQDNLSNLQQQHLISQPTSHSNMHQQQLGPQSSVPQQQLRGTQSGSSSMQTNQHSMHLLQQPKMLAQQQNQQTGVALLPNQDQQSQVQMSQQQLVSQIHSQPGQIQQQPNLLQRDMQQRLQTSVPMIQQQNPIDQQKQLFQTQRAVPEAPSTSLDSTAQTGNTNGGDWQEEIYQKIKSMREMYLGDLNEMFQKISAKVQHHDSLPQQPKNEQFEKLKLFKLMLERHIAFLQVPKGSIQPNYREKIPAYEKQITSFLRSSRPPHKPGTVQPGQLLPQPSQSHPHENQVSPQIQAMNSLAPVQQNSMTNLQHSALSSGPGVSNAQQNMVSSLQATTNFDSGQGSTLNTLQHVAVGSLQQNSVSGPQQVSINSLSSQSGINTIQSNMNALQSNSNMLQHQQLKQQEQQMMHTHQLKQQFQPRHMQQQLLHKQQMMQQQQQSSQQQPQPQLQQQPKQQQTTQLPAHQLPQFHHISDGNDLKIRQQMAVKQGVFQQHHYVGQRSVYHQHQSKTGSPFPSSSPQLLHSQSPQIPQHSSPQIDQSNLLSTKTGTPLQSANSPFVVPSPSTPLAPSPMQGESDKINSGVSALPNAANVGHTQATGTQAPAQSLAIGTPGISASPLLAEFTSTDGNHVNGSTLFSGKSSVTEQPLDRLIKVVKSMSPKALNASVNDIGSVVGMIDRIAGSAPGNGSRAAVGEDLVAMTKCRLQARNFIAQDGNSGSKKMRRYTTAMPLNAFSSSGSVNDSFKQMNCLEASDLESTATSSIKRPRTEANHTLLEEIREINQRLIDTVLDISDEDVDPTAVAAVAEGGDGTIVKCSFMAIALSPNLKSQYASAQMSPIQPLRLLVPANYPNCSPVLLDRFPVEVSNEYEDLSVKAKSRFSISLRSLSQPMSLGEIARTWDVCARAVISEYAQQSGGGSFSSKYGAWENCLSAA